MSKYISKGIICVKDELGLVYNLCEITYEIISDDNFSYIFKPNYSVINLLETPIFYGIPGIDLNLKKEFYVRDNKIPVFISERVPQKSRENYQEYLIKYNMEFMDPIKFLILSDEQYFGDKLFVVNYHEPEKVKMNGNQRSDFLVKRILEEICKGNIVSYNGVEIDDYNRKDFFLLLSGIYSNSLKRINKVISEGIKNAKSKGLYAGRKPVYVNLEEFLKNLEEVDKKNITAIQAAKNLHISIDKYYRYKKSLNIIK